MLIELAVRLGVTGESPTSKLCEWIKAKKKVEPAPLRNMEFTKPKWNVPLNEHGRKVKVWKKPIIPIGEMELQTLKLVNPMAALFTSLEDEAPGKW